VFRTKAADQVFGDHIIHDSINNWPTSPWTLPL
jgi:hypothetical protein